MTEKELVLKSLTHPEWKGIKESNPSLYEELRQKAISERLEELLPIITKWQKRIRRFATYERSLPNLMDQLHALPYSKYTKGIKSKMELTDTFYKECMSFPVEQIIKASENLSSKEWIIKDLLNKSAIKLFKKREYIITRTQWALDLSADKINELPFLSYIPFYNHLIAIDWIKTLNLDIDKIEQSLAILLCHDEKLFSSDIFLQDLEKLLGTDICGQIAQHLINKMDKQANFNWLEFRVSYKNINSWGKLLRKKLRISTKKLNKEVKKDLIKKTVKLDVRKETSLAASAMDDPVIKTIESFIRGVKAKHFIIKTGYISYDKHTLISSKIIEDVPSSILSNIDINFTLKLRMNITKSGKVKNKMFTFEPFSDLTLLLAECEKVHEILSLKPVDFFPQTGEFYLPWRYVLFYDRVMYLAHPNPSKYGSLHPYSYRHPSITKSFRDLMPYIEMRCEKFKVRAQDGVICGLFNFKPFLNMIPQYRTRSTGVHGGIDISVYNKLSNEYNSVNFTNLKFVKKSLFLSHLASIQVPSRKIYRILELVCHAQSDSDYDEFGFIFTVKETRTYSLIMYENVSDESRSSILFRTNTSLYEQAIEVIRSFFASHEINKRQRLAQSVISFKSPSILSYRRLHHTSFYDWRYNLSQQL